LDVAIVKIMDEQRIVDYQRSYDRIADEYARRIYDELQHKPLDRQLLDRFAASVRDLGPACDMGCGPGHVARYLHDHGANVLGVDLSPGMIELARRLNPGIEFRQGNMLALNVEGDAWGGVAAFYSIIHIPREDIVAALHELKRVLRPGGLLLLVFHIGDEIVHRDELWGVPVNLDFVFFQPEEMVAYLESAGFEIEDVIVRWPYKDVEHQSRRCYIVAKKPRPAAA
jgi:SAM-dependent methyltransferase